MSNSSEPDALELAMRDFQFGDFDTKIKSIVRISKIDKDKFEKMGEAIIEVFNKAGTAGDQRVGAMQLADHGIKCEPVVPILVQALKEISTDPGPGRLARYGIIMAMSHLRGEPRVIQALKHLYEYGSGFENEREYALCALGAIGDLETKPLIEYAAGQGNWVAKSALNLFGVGTFPQIQEQAGADRGAAQKKEKSGCFIATAVYNDPDSLQVETLRIFRDRFLCRSKLGRNVVSFYYRSSPPVATWISTRNNFKSLIRYFIIHPLYQLARLLMILSESHNGRR